MYDVTLCGFKELETREFFTIGTLASGCCKSDATEFAASVAEQVHPVAWVLTRAHDCDGISVDITNGHGTTVTSYELDPYRPLVVYHGDECHS